MDKQANHTRLESLIEAAASRLPDHTAITQLNDNQWQPITTKALWQLSASYQAELNPFELLLGERIVLLVHNSIDAVAILIAVLRAIATAVMIDPDLLQKK